VHGPGSTPHLTEKDGTAAVLRRAADSVVACILSLASLWEHLARTRHDATDAGPTRSLALDFADALNLTTACVPTGLEDCTGLVSYLVAAHLICCSLEVESIVAFLA
jgi:hypothetical protein